MIKIRPNFFLLLVVMGELVVALAASVKHGLAFIDGAQLSSFERHFPVAALGAFLWRERKQN